MRKLFFSDKKIYDIHDLIFDRANGAFIIPNNKIYGFLVLLIKIINFVEISNLLILKNWTNGLKSKTSKY